MAEVITTQDKRDFERLDNIVSRGKDAFIEVGNALAEIQERKLYKIANYKSFDAYTKAVHSIGRHRAYQLIEGAAAAKSVEQVQQKPNAKQAAELAKVPEEKREEVWQEVVSEGKPTAARVREVAAAIVEPEEDEEEPEEEAGFDLAYAKTPFTEVLRGYDNTFKLLKSVKDSLSGGYIRTCWVRMEEAHKHIRALVAGCQPECVCDKCNGDGCRDCEKTGFLNKGTKRNRL